MIWSRDIETVYYIVSFSYFVVIMFVLYLFGVWFSRTQPRYKWGRMKWKWLFVTHVSSEFNPSAQSSESALGGHFGVRCLFFSNSCWCVIWHLDSLRGKLYPPFFHVQYISHHSTTENMAPLTWSYSVPTPITTLVIQTQLCVSHPRIWTVRLLHIFMSTVVRH